MKSYLSTFRLNSQSHGFLFRKSFSSPRPFRVCLGFLLVGSVFQISNLSLLFIQNLVFVQGNRHQSNFMLLHVDIQLSHQRLLEIFLFSSVCFWYFCRLLNGWGHTHTLARSPVLFLGLHVSFVPVLYCYYYCGSVI